MKNESASREIHERDARIQSGGGSINTVEQERTSRRPTIKWELTCMLCSREFRVSKYTHNLSCHFAFCRSASHQRNNLKTSIEPCFRITRVSLFPDRRKNEVEADGSPSPTGSHSPVMDRNPSPPPETTGGDEDGELDAIGDTVYSKHWLFSTLTRLINVRCWDRKCVDTFNVAIWLK